MRVLMFTSGVALRGVFLSLAILQQNQKQCLMPENSPWTGFVICNVKNSVNPSALARFRASVGLQTGLNNSALLKAPPALRASTARSRHHRALLGRYIVLFLSSWQLGS